MLGKAERCGTTMLQLSQIPAMDDMTCREALQSQHCSRKCRKPHLGIAMLLELQPSLDTHLHAA